MRRIDLRTVQAAHLNTIRNINRQIVLNYVREKEPISRATIAREMALQRSTVSEIVESLTAEGLIEEVGEGESTGGRRPTLLKLRYAGAMAVGVNITPTYTTVATSDLGGRLVEQQTFQTDSDPQRLLGQIIETIRQFSEKASIEGVGISVPGLVDPATGQVVFVPYFKWRDWPIAETISRRTGLPVTIDNDANAVALAELWFGRPEVSAARDFILVLVAEGVGTGIIFDGQVYRGERGAAGEGDARSALTETARYLSIGISNLVVGFSPEAVVVNGAITRAWPLIEKALTEKIERSVRRGLPSARILPSTLSGDPTLMGAFSLVLTSKFAAAAA